MAKSYVHLADAAQLLPEIPADSIVSRTLYNGDDMKVTLFGFAAGQELSEHTALQPAVLHFLQGDADLTLGSDRMEAHPGTWVHMPANLPHGIRANTPVAMMLYLLKSGD